MSAPLLPSLATLFGELSELPPARRAERLGELARESPEGARELAALLDADVGAGDFFGVLRPGGSGGAGDSGELDAGWPGADTRVGPYRVERRLGAGGMGTVWLARDERLGRPVALKFLRDDWPDAARAGAAPGAGARARFLDEARAAAALDHPHIAGVYDVGEAPGGRFYIAMAYCEGGSLAERLAGGPLAPAEAARVGAQLARALGAAHARGIVHRDVKPANVLFDAAGKVRLTDFGVAKLPGGDATRPGLVVGTVAYLAPEQVRGERADARSDLWALGVTLYEALAGRRPFAGASHAAVLHAVLHAEPEPLGRAAPDVPPALAAVVERLLAKDPAGRPASADEVVRALADGSRTTAVRATVPRRPAPGAVRTPLVGRERLLADAAAMLAGGVRLLTLTGPGGAGKTRLADELAHRVRERHADGAHVVPLAAVAAADLVPTAVAQALGLRDVGAGGAGEQVARHLGARASLLVLDSFEHLLDAAPFVGGLLAAAPRLAVVVTSREPLRLRAEQELPVPPLTLPDPAAAGAAAIAEAEAVRLFVQRARAGRPDFALTDENARDVAAVCRRLDGLPLALELAAARARLLSPRALLARLEHRFDLLRSDARDAEPRHRTLRDVIDWSYALLAPDEQATFDALSVFVGGFTLDAAAAVAAAGSGAPDVLDRVASLCDKSLLVRREDADGEPRFDMLETVRAYGLARLRDTPRDAAVRARHARWMAEVADVLSDEVGSPARARALARVHPDMDNALAALAWSTGPGGDPVDALRVAGGLTMFWHWLGLWEQGRGWAEAAVRAADAAATARGQPDDAARPLPERVGLGKALQAVTLLGWMLGDAPGALAHAGRALRVWRSVEGDAAADARTRARAAELQTYACSVTAFAHLALGDPVEADRSAAAGVAAADRSGSAWARGFALGWRSMLTTALGRPDDAAADLARAERELRSIGDSWALAWCYTNASAAALAQGDAALAAQHARDAVAALRREPDWQYVARGLDALAAAGAAWLEGVGDGQRRAHPECDTVASTAATLLGAATGVRERSGTTGWEYDRRMHDATAARLRTALGPAAFDASWAGGRTLPADEVFALAARADLTPAAHPGRPLGTPGAREATGGHERRGAARGAGDRAG